MSTNVLVWLAVLLIVLWAAAWTLFKVAGLLIHVVLIVAVVLLIVGAVRRAGSHSRR